MVAALDKTRSYRRAFWAAVLITVAAWLLPFGSWAIYPFSLLATWAHEMGHGLAALLVGGTFHKLEVFVRLSGMATTSSGSGFPQAIVALGGLIGAPLLGAAIIALGPRPSWSRGILLGLGTLVLFSVLLWVRNTFGLISLLAIASVLVLVGLKLNPRHRFILVQLLGIQLSLSTLRGLDYLFMADARVGGRILQSDVSSMAQVLGGPYWLWGALIMIFNLAVLYGAYRLVIRRLSNETAPSP